MDNRAQGEKGYKNLTPIPKSPFESKKKKEWTGTGGIDATDIESQKTQLENERYSSDTSDRKWLAKWAVWVVSLWLIAVILIVVLHGFLLSVSDPVLIALLGTTTLNILGLTYIVLKGYFPPGPNPNPSPNPNE